MQVLFVQTRAVSSLWSISNHQPGSQPLSRTMVMPEPHPASPLPPPVPASSPPASGPMPSPSVVGPGLGDVPHKWGSLATLSAQAPTLAAGPPPLRQRVRSPDASPRPGPRRSMRRPPGGSARLAPSSPSPPSNVPLASRIHTILGADCGPEWAPFLAKLAVSPPPDWPPLPAEAGGDGPLATWVADTLQLLPHVSHLQPCLASLGPAPALFKSASRSPALSGQPLLADLLPTPRASHRREKRALSASPSSPSSPVSGGPGTMRSPPRCSARLRRSGSPLQTLLESLRPDPDPGRPASQ